MGLCPPKMLQSHHHRCYNDLVPTSSNPTSCSPDCRRATSHNRDIVHLGELVDAIELLACTERDCITSRDATSGWDETFGQFDGRLICMCPQSKSILASAPTSEVMAGVLDHDRYPVGASEVDAGLHI